ncbi:MAG: ATP-binding protein, partial [Thermoanaerobaculia bacterium]
MSDPTPTFERLGVFYLGRGVDPATMKATAEPLLYDSRDLVTHAAIVGMTGSGKTGLGIAMLEEAALDGVPAVVVDPKGDLTNLLLTFPRLRPEDFQPWVRTEDAERKGVTRDELAAGEAKKWREGLAAWGQDGERIQRLRDTAGVVLFTPGSDTGRPLSILASFAAPAAEVIADSDLFRDRVETAATSLLALLGVKAEPLQSREHILLASLFEARWKAGKGYDLSELIAHIQSPPIPRVGVLDVETFYPAQERFALALRLNNLLAAPGFDVWMRGEPLAFDHLLYGAGGKPRLAVVSIAHLSDAERMFLVSLLLNEAVAWMRGRSGSSSLRALLYMDEVFGYLPPVENPPSKKPMLTLLKQARAFGLGVVLATQNPVDLDYKGLSNIGTWFLGRLQTERDKARVLDGLEGASTASGASFDRATMDRLLSGLRARLFLLHNVHDEAPVLMETRWVMSYLAGPLDRAQLRGLAGRGEVPPAPAAGRDRA